MAAQARPSFSGSTRGGHTSNGSARAYNGTVTGSRGGTLQGTGGRLVVPGQGAARAGTYNGTGANGGTYQSQGVNVMTRQGGFHQNAGSWNGQNSTGSFDSSGSWKAGQGGQSSSSAEATSKKTGQTYTVDSNTQYDPNVGGSTTVTTGGGKSKTVDYPAKTP
ncbi:hypothetical protein ABS71_16365 [bacterium SCN 62-11]|nr:MAG: hypothetical protein ABS71_16365 [bacterium SCN 62-11]